MVKNDKRFVDYQMQVYSIATDRPVLIEAKPSSQSTES